MQTFLWQPFNIVVKSFKWCAIVYSSRCEHYLLDICIVPVGVSMSNLDDYDQIKHLADGGFGKAYLYERKRDKVKFVVKVSCFDRSCIAF